MDEDSYFYNSYTCVVALLLSKDDGQLKCTDHAHWNFFSRDSGGSYLSR